MEGKKLMDRNLYRIIKRKDQKEMEEFVTNVYNIGKEDTLQEIRENLEWIRTEISKIKGIGEVKLNQIMEIISKKI